MALVSNDTCFQSFFKSYSVVLLLLTLSPLGILGSALHDFILPFSRAFLTEWRSFWYGLKDLFSLYKENDKIILDRLNMTSRAVQGT